MNAAESIELRLERVPQYVKIFTGVDAKRSELNRFYARRGAAGHLIKQAVQAA